MRNQRHRRNRASSRGAATHSCRFGTRPHPIVQHVIHGKSYRMVYRAIRRTRRPGSNHFVRIRQQRRYGKSCCVRRSIALFRQSISRYVRPQSIRRIRPRSILINPLPHFIQRGLAASASLHVHKHVTIAVRLRRSLRRRVSRNRPRREVRLIDRSCNRNVRLIGWNLYRGNPVREWSIVAEKRFHRSRQITTEDGRRRRIVHRQARRRRIHSMVKNGSRRKNIRKERVAAINRKRDLLRCLRVHGIFHDDLWSVRPLPTDERAADHSSARIN